MKLVRHIALALVLAPAFPARAAGPLIGISATPRQVELVPGARATLRIAAPEMPALSASVGNIEKLHSVEQGVFEATYVPPRETYPQVAIIVARSARGFGWLALPLAGTGEVAVKPDASGSGTVTIGSRRFGPQRPGPDGRALIRIVVPPGIRSAMSGGKRMNLNTPNVSHVYVLVDRSAAASDEGATIQVRAFAVTPEGKPRRRAPLELDVTPGHATAAREIEPGVFESRWSLPPGSTDAAVVEARLGDEPTFVSRATVQRDAARSRRLRIEVDRPSVVAGEGTLDFSVVVEDGAGNPADDVSPRATASVGTFLGWTRGMPGRWTGHLSVPERLDGTSKLVIIATAGELMARQEVKLLAGATANLSVDLDGKASSGSPVTVSVAAVDRFGNPTDDSKPEAKAVLGVLDAPIRKGVGLYQLAYHPPADGTAPRDEITVHAGRTERVMRVPLYEPASSALTIGLKGGAAAKSGRFGPVVGAESALWTGLGGGQLGLVLDGSWFGFSQSLTVTGPSGPLNVNSSASYLAFTAAPAWRQPLGRRAMMWVSIGGGVAHVQSGSKLTGQPEIKESRWVAAGTAAVSLGAKVWHGYPFLELRGSMIADPRLTSLTGSFTPLFLQLGYRFDAF